MRGRPIDETGRRYGRWAVLRRAGRTKGHNGCLGQATWLCRCDCGYEAVQQGSNLRNGKTTRCIRCHLSAIGSHASRARRFGRRGDPCPCGQPPKRGESECGTCNRRAVRNGRYPCDHARYRTKPTCPICPGGAE